MRIPYGWIDIRWVNVSVLIRYKDRDERPGTLLLSGALNRLVLKQVGVVCPLHSPVPIGDNTK